jgi:hypothetical protein
MRCAVGEQHRAEPVTAYVGRPDDEQSITHRPGVEDVCTVVTLDERLAHDMAVHDPRTVPSRPLLTTGRIDLAQRTLVGSWRALHRLITQGGKTGSEQAADHTRERNRPESACNDASISSRLRFLVSGSHR